METILTIPKNRIVPSLVVAGLGTLACASSSQGMLTTLLEAGGRSPGSNVTWLEIALSEFSPAPAEDLYVLSIQQRKSLTAKAQDAALARSDREALLEIKEVLSLTGIQLAKAMGVSRSALYQWIEESKTMRPKSRERLERLKALSDQWSKTVGLSISRSPWVSGSQRARLVEVLMVRNENSQDVAQELLAELAALKQESKPTHRSILEITKERNWKKLPEHIKRAQWSSRRPSSGPTPDPS